MLKYIREYKIADMKDMIRNTKKQHLRSMESLQGKTAVIAGGTSGVGLSAVRVFAQYNCNLVLIARNEQKVKKLVDELQNEFKCTVVYYLADFTILEEVHKAAERILKEVPSVDILINSAGIHSTRKIYTQEGFESVFCVNYLAPFILTYRLITKLQQSPAARIIQVNSQGHRFNGFNINDLNWKKRIYTGLRGYGASKTAQLLSVWEFADRLEHTQITINAMHPGEVKSNIGSNNGPLYRWFHDKVVSKSLKDVIISGESLHYLASAPELSTVSGMYFNLTHPEKPAPHALDRETGALLWGKTLALTGLSSEKIWMSSMEEKIQCLKIL
ncbi:MAG: SDR family NAD(P)-dependent oxidoreductase [Spirochaetes bacterium]|nr:SDR family NAD(P)-dependent oxidoreductase [Spirochaetota bacterium]